MAFLEKVTPRDLTEIEYRKSDICVQDDPEDQPIEASASEEIEFMEQEMSANEAEAEDYYDEEDEITDRVELEMVPHNDLS